MRSNSRIVSSNDPVNRRIDTLATKAFSLAYQAALHSSEGVCAVVDGVLYRVFTDGTRGRIKKVASRIKVE